MKSHGQQKIAILHLEDMSFDAELVQRTLVRGGVDFDITVVEDKAGFVEALSRNVPDVILSDHSLPDYDSISALHHVQNSGLDLPFILITGTVSEEIAVEVLKMGADDYLMKGRLERLPAAIFNAIDKHKIDRERKHLLDLALQTERRFRLLIESSEDMLALSHQDGRIFYASPSFVRNFGYTEDEIKSAVCHLFVAEPDRDLYIQNRQRIAKDPGSSFYQQLRAIHKDGRLVWCEGTFTNLLKEIGIEAIVSNFRIITEKKEAEIQKQFDKENLDALINNTDDLMWSIDLNYRLISCNQPFIDAINLSSGKFIKVGDNIFDFKIDQLDEIVYKSNYDRVFSTDSFMKIEFVDKYEGFWFQISFKPIWHKNKVVGAACHLRDVTKIKQTNQQLAIHERRFRSLIENSSDSFAIINLEGKTTYASPSIESVVGYTEEELKDLAIFNLIHPDFLEEAAETWRYVIERPGVPTPKKPTLIKHKDGNYRWMEGTVTNMLNDPAINGIIDNFRDVTEKVLAEKELKLIQYGIDNVADSVFWVNPDGKIKNVNQAACQILEYSKEELTNLSIPEIDPDMPEDLWLIHMAELKEKGTLVFETQHTTKSGRNIPVEIRANFIKFGDDEINCSFVRDISNRKAKQNLLIQKDQRLMEAQDLAKIGSWEIDLVEKTANLSDETCRIYGLETSQNIQKLEDWIGYLHPEDKDRVLASKHISGKQSDQNYLKYRIVLKNGAVKHVRDKSKVEFNPAGQPVLVLGITQDITELIS
jgi:PAS domain S-box-containing protein